MNNFCVHLLTAHGPHLIKISTHKEFAYAG